MILALVLLLFVFAAVVLAIVLFVFPPSKWVEWAYKSGRKEEK
jgi:hypothetical protein